MSVGETKDGRAKLKSIATLDGSVQFRDWIDQFARSARLSKQSLIEHALVRFAESQGFRQAPER